MTILSQGNIVIRQAMFHDIAELAPRMRAADVAEIWASNRYTPEAALEIGLEKSDICMTVLYKNEVAAMLGVTAEGVVWMLTSDTLEQFKKGFAKLSRQLIEELLKQYPVLFNYVDARHTQSITWLKWCGAKFEAAVPCGPDRLLFIKFEFRRGKLCAA